MRAREVDRVVNDVQRVVIVGNRGGTNVGGAFERALPRLGHDVHLIEARLAMEAPMLVRRVNWWVRGRRPTLLGQFSRAAVTTCEERRPACLISTGIAPLDAAAVKALGRAGIPTMNYLTDDPWSRRHRAPWFLRALPYYRVVWTTRRANVEDLERLGCRDVRYLPFAYDPELHHPQDGRLDAGVEPSDVFFAGGADRDRIPFLEALIQAGVRVALYGDYWGRYPETRFSYRGYASPEVVRSAVSATKVCLCLVRRANRDGHVMRSFEIPAMQGCMLCEDTEEHRALFGQDREAVAYFRTRDEMVEKTRWLLARPDERARLARAAHEIVTRQPHTYQDRLAVMLKALGDLGPTRLEALRSDGRPGMGASGRRKRSQ